MLLGATKPKTDMTTASVEESFYIKTEKNPRSIKLKFHLKDQDHMSDDDLLGHVSTLYVYKMKWRKKSSKKSNSGKTRTI